VSENPRPPADYLELVEGAVLHGQLLAQFTDSFLTADNGDQAIEAGRELLEELKEAGPVFRRVLPWWTITQPPADPPAAASFFQWTFRRALAAFAHAFAAAGEDGWGNWTRVSQEWNQVRAFVRQHVPPVDLKWLEIRLIAEWQAAKPTQVQLSIPDSDLVDAQIEAIEHWYDAKAQPAACPWTEEEMDDLQKLPRRLLLHMIGREEADLTDLCPKVWGEPYCNLKSSALKMAITKVNHFLGKQGCRRSLEKARGEPRLRWV
jgi:hypothetical protein